MMRMLKKVITLLLCIAMTTVLSPAAPAASSSQGYLSEITIHIPDVPGEITDSDMLTEIHDLQVTLTDVYELYDWEKGDPYKPDLVTGRYFYFGESATVTFNHDVYLDWEISESTVLGEEVFLPFRSVARA